jgi:hypothetical protein
VSLKSQVFYHVDFDDGSYSDNLFPEDVQVRGLKSFDIGESHDQADAEWIVIRRQLRGHNDTPFGRPAPQAGPPGPP